MEDTTYLNLDIVFRSDNHGDVERYSVRARNSLDDGISRQQPFNNPLTDQERRVLSGDSARPTNLNPQSAGLRLFDALFQDEVRDLLVRSREQAKAMAGLRLRLHLNDTPELAQLTWEYLYDPTQSRFLTLAARLSIVRYLDLGETPPALQVDPPPTPRPRTEYTYPTCGLRCRSTTASSTRWTASIVSCMILAASRRRRLSGNRRKLGEWG